jgi:hypothetical protein
MPLVTKSAYARSRGCSPAAVTSAIKSGRIKEAVVVKDGKELLDFDKANDLWTRNTQQQPPSTQTPATPSELPSDRALRAFIEGLPEDEIPDLNWSRARREHYSAEREKIGTLKDRGEVIVQSKTKAEAFACARAVRDALLSLADRLAPQLAATTDARECHRLLTEEHRIALRGLADG